MQALGPRRELTASEVARIRDAWESSEATQEEMARHHRISKERLLQLCGDLPRRVVVATRTPRRHTSPRLRRAL